MRKYLTLFVCFWAFKDVLCLKCFVFNPIESVTKNEIVNDLQECGDPNYMIPTQTKIDTKHMSQSISWKCVKMVATGGGTQEAPLKYCMPEGVCDSLNKNAEKIPQFAGKNLQVQCYECDQDGCNAAPKRAVFGLLGVVLTSVVLSF